MTADKKAAKIVGVFFILAAATSIIGLVLYNPLLKNPNWLAEGAGHANQIILGALMELALVVSAVGTAVAMFPFLRKHNERIALAHVCFRFLEAVIITIGIVSVLALLTLSREFVAAANPSAAAYQAAGTALKALHDWTFMLGPNFMLGINTLMYSYVFYRSRLVPRFIPILGLAGSVLVFAAAVLELFGVIAQVSLWGGLLSLPVAANEMTLAFWLLIKGFNASAVAGAAGPARAEANERLLPA